MNTSTTSRTTCRTANDIGARTAVSTARTTSSRHLFEMAEKTFSLLTQGPSPLAVDGAVVGHGLPARVIPLNELRDILLHPCTGDAARDAAWRVLIGRARQRSSAWVVGCLGVALPGLRTTLRRNLRRCVAWEEQRGTDRVAGELLVAFYDALLDIDINRPGIAARLLWRATETIQRTYAPRVHVVPVEPQVLAELVPHRGGADVHVDLLMDAAVQQGVITRSEAEIITQTRLEKVAPDSYARQIGVSYEALMKRRRRGREASGRGDVRRRPAGAHRGPGGPDVQPREITGPLLSERASRTRRRPRAGWSPGPQPIHPSAHFVRRKPVRPGSVSASATPTLFDLAISGVAAGTDPTG